MCFFQYGDHRCPENPFFVLTRGLSRCSCHSHTSGYIGYILTFSEVFTPLNNNKIKGFENLKPPFQDALKSTRYDGAWNVITRSNSCCYFVLPSCKEDRYTRRLPTHYLYEIFRNWDCWKSILLIMVWPPRYCSQASSFKKSSQAVVREVVWVWGFFFHLASSMLGKDCWTGRMLLFTFFTSL